MTAFVATGNDPRFTQVPEMVSAALRFPGERLASFVCGFGEAKTFYVAFRSVTGTTPAAYRRSLAVAAPGNE